MSCSNAILVLFSERDGCWKLADFGSAAEATSKSLHTTRDRRGTASYRAPEVLEDFNASYNNKADIFALGCILYEITTGQKLFKSDWAVREYSLKENIASPLLWPESPSGTRLWSLGKLDVWMLEVHPVNRPRAKDVQTRMHSIRLSPQALPTRNPAVSRRAEATGRVDL